MFVTFSFLISISSAQAKMSDQECKQSMEAYVNKYSPAMTKEPLTKQDEINSARASYVLFEHSKVLLDQGCADSPYFKKTNSDLAAYNNVMTNLKKECIKMTGKEDCGSNQNSTGERSESEEQINQSQQLAQENQSKADAARQGKRKVHDPAAEAHHCIKVNTGGSTGSMVNTCNFKISYVDCRYNNTSDELKNWLTCEKQKFGFGFIDAHNEDLTFTRKVQKIYWFACKEPSRPVDYNFVEGRGISGRCHDTANSD